VGVVSTLTPPQYPVVPVLTNAPTPGSSIRRSTLARARGYHSFAITRARTCSQLLHGRPQACTARHMYFGYLLLHLFAVAPRYLAKIQGPGRYNALNCAPTYYCPTLCFSMALSRCFKLRATFLQGIYPQQVFR